MNKIADGTLRNKLLTALVLVIISCSPRSESPGNIAALYIGTYTTTDSEGVYRVDFDLSTGAFGSKTLVARTENPSYLALDESKQCMYVVNEVGEGKISSFRWDDQLGLFEFVTSRSSEGSYPCYVSLDQSGSLISFANYGTGNVGFYAVENGNIERAMGLYQHEGEPGSDLKRQEKAHAHYSGFSHGYAFAADLGIDEIVAYRIEEGQVTGMKTAIRMESGDGPRHLAFHPLRNFVFVINELSNTVVSMSANYETGRLEAIDRKSTLPEDFDGQSYCADIHISADGMYLYASNRGHNSIATFQVSDTGELTFSGTVGVEGDWPRNFTLSPDGKWLIVANQRSGNVTVFSIGENGKPAYTGNELEVSDPVCLKF